MPVRSASASSDHPRSPRSCARRCAIRRSICVVVAVDSAFSCISISRIYLEIETAQASLPAIDLQIVRRRAAFPGFEERLEAQEKDAPLGAAVVHEVHWLL